MRCWQEYCVQLQQGSATRQQDDAGGRQVGVNPYCLCLTKFPAEEQKYVLHTIEYRRIPKATKQIAATFITISSLGMDEYMWLKKE